MKHTNREIASSESLWDEYYNTSAMCPFDSMDYEERLSNLNRDYPDVSAAARALGSIKTSKKAASSRENGKKGGRPAGCISAEKAHLLDSGAWSSPKGWFIRDRFLGRTIKEAFGTLMADFYSANKR